MISNDAVFDAMAASQRRRLLVCLLHHDPQPVPQLSSVSEEILEAHEAYLAEYLSGPQEVARADKEDIRIHHVHLPKLAEYGFIEWNRDGDLVTKGPEFDDVKPLLDVLDGEREEHPVEGVAITVPE